MALAAIGTAFVAFGWRLPRGSARLMGPGFMPVAVGCIVLAMGAALAAHGARAGGPGVERGRWRPALAVLGAVVAFALALEPLGLPIAAALIVAVACLAQRRSAFETVALALALAFGTWLVFIRLLRLPLPEWPWPT